MAPLTEAGTRRTLTRTVNVELLRLLNNLSVCGPAPATVAPGAAPTGATILITAVSQPATV